MSAQQQLSESFCDSTQHTGENWMSFLPHEVVQKPLVYVAIPGSHDSFAQALFDNCPVANDKSRLFREIGRFRLVRRMIRRWATTQRFSVVEQLHAGVRYFDVRLTVPLATKLDGIRVLHALYGERIEQFLVDINAFLDSHSREIVILDFNHLYNFDNNSYAQFLKMLECVFGSKLCPREEDVTKISLAGMWSAGYQVIAISAAEKGAPSTSWIWGPRCIMSPYANVNRTDRLFEFLGRTLRDHRKGPRNVFFVTQAILTAKWKDVSLHPFSTLENHCALKCTKEATVWITTFDEPSFFNIIICDFVDLFDFCDVVFSLNSKSSS
ncbi:unnamed protein product [Gongylonema pulchrum]|uniref:PLCXc domain-containing protein n=1 Tax=Gongylonema pulchrum TaxID=637853 RepID=A0A183E5R4_9BILA|nr:unnamed protein product [Gongylonema pulchrum]